MFVQDYLFAKCSILWTGKKFTRFECGATWYWFVVNFFCFLFSFCVRCKRFLTHTHTKTTLNRFWCDFIIVLFLIYLFVALKLNCILNCNAPLSSWLNHPFVWINVCRFCLLHRQSQTIHQYNKRTTKKNSGQIEANQLAKTKCTIFEFDCVIDWELCRAG